MPRLEITTMVGCPLQCTFCPQTNLKGAYSTHKADKYLTGENFKRIIDKLPRHVRIDFSGMSEPWANPNCTDMLRYALEKGFQVAVYTTLYGMGGDDAEVVISLLKRHHKQVDLIKLHLPDGNGNMRGWKPSREWEEVFKAFCGLKRVISKFKIMTMDGSGRPHDSLTHLNIELEGWTGSTRAGNLQAELPDLADTPHHSTAVSCGKTPFYDHNVLLPNGDVCLCRMDYSLQHVIGNLLRQDYYDLFRNEAFTRLLQENMRPGFSKCSLCKSCGSAAQWALNPDSTWRVTHSSKPEARRTHKKKPQHSAKRFGLYARRVLLSSMSHDEVEANQLAPAHLDGT